MTAARGHMRLRPGPLTSEQPLPSWSAGAQQRTLLLLGAGPGASSWGAVCSTAGRDVAAPCGTHTHAALSRAISRRTADMHTTQADQHAHAGHAGTGMLRHRSWHSVHAIADAARRVCREAGPIHTHCVTLAAWSPHCAPAWAWRWGRASRRRWRSARAGPRSATASWDPWPPWAASMAWPCLCASRSSVPGSWLRARCVWLPYLTLSGGTGLQAAFCVF